MGTLVAPEVGLKEVFEKAHAAGMAAGATAIPAPMVVTHHADMLDDSSPPVRQWYESEGACGFAWVTIYPGTSRAAKFAKKYWDASAAYGGGTRIYQD